MRGNLWIGIAILLSVVLGSVLTPAAEPLDFTSCSSGTVPISLWKTEGMTINIIDHMGISHSNHENKLFDKVTNRCIGIVRYLPEKRISNGYCKYRFPNDDSAVLEWTGSGKPGVGTWRFLEGTGKWEGITGSGDWHVVARGKSIEKGTFQICVRVTGTVEVPK